MTRQTMEAPGSLKNILKIFKCQNIQEMTIIQKIQIFPHAVSTLRMVRQFTLFITPSAPSFAKHKEQLSDKITRDINLYNIIKLTSNITKMNIN